VSLYASFKIESHRKQFTSVSLAMRQAEMGRPSKEEIRTVERRGRSRPQNASAPDSAGRSRCFRVWRIKTLAQLCSFLEESRVARQKFPERLELVAELPKTPSGKIRKFVLREQIRAQLESERPV